MHGDRGIPLALGPGRVLHAPASFIHNQIDPLELTMIARLLDAINPGDCFYDIGASIGLHSLVAAERLGTDGRIHAFEPEFGSSVQYWANTRLLRRRGLPLELHRCFVADQSRDFSPDRTRVEFTDAELARANSECRHLYFSDATASAHPVVALDDYVATGRRPPSVIKCDIEGAEVLFLRGALRTIRTHRPLLFLSVHPTLLPAFGHTEQDVRDLLHSLNYGWELIDEAGERHVLAQPLHE